MLLPGLRNVPQATLQPILPPVGLLQGPQASCRISRQESLLFGESGLKLGPNQCAALGDRFPSPPISRFTSLINCVASFNSYGRKPSITSACTCRMCWASI